MATESEINAGSQIVTNHGVYWALGDQWPALVKAILEGAERVRAEYKRKNCTHSSKNGSGQIGSDGSSKWTWYCRDCGASGQGETPPNPARMQAVAMF